MDRIEEDSFFFIECVCVLCIRLTQIDIHQQISKLFSGVCLDRCSCKTRCYIPRNVDIYESLILYRSLHFFILQIKIQFSTQIDRSLGSTLHLSYTLYFSPAFSRASQTTWTGGNLTRVLSVITQIFLPPRFLQSCSNDKWKRPENLHSGIGIQQEHFQMLKSSVLPFQFLV